MRFYTYRALKVIKHETTLPADRSTGGGIIIRSARGTTGVFKGKTGDGYVVLVQRKELNMEITWRPISRVIVSVPVVLSRGLKKDRDQAKVKVEVPDRSRCGSVCSKFAYFCFVSPRAVLLFSSTSPIISFCT